MDWLTWVSSPARERVLPFFVVTYGADLDVLDAVASSPAAPALAMFESCATYMHGRAHSGERAAPASHSRSSALTGRSGRSSSSTCSSRGLAGGVADLEDLGREAADRGGDVAHRAGDDRGDLADRGGRGLDGPLDGVLADLGPGSGRSFMGTSPQAATGSAHNAGPVVRSSPVRQRQPADLAGDAASCLPAGRCCRQAVALADLAAPRPRSPGSGGPAGPGTGGARSGATGCRSSGGRACRR